MMPSALVAAIFAIASCIDRPSQYTPNTIVQKYPTPEEFLDDALHALQAGADGREGQMINALTPSITACQVLTILSLQQHGVAEFARAATLSSLASGMAIDLRLHRHSEADDAIQAEIKSRLWWNLYILDKLIANEMGKPIFLRTEDTDCPVPSAEEADEFELMYTKASTATAHGARRLAIKLRTISGLHSTIALCKNIERIIREVYGVNVRKAIRDDQVAGEAKRMELWLILQEWERDMETSPLRLDLSKDLTSVPAAITNYVVRLPILSPGRHLMRAGQLAVYNTPPPSIHCSLGN